MGPERQDIRTIFMGTSPFAIPSLRALAGSFDVVAVITQPDRPRGRGRKVSPTPVKECAIDLGLPILQPERVREPSFIARLHALKPDLVAVAAFGQIIPPAILNLPKLGCVNIHPSLLPKYRGAAPINWAIINGESFTGVTTILMDEGMDTGDILVVREVAIDPDETAQELSERLAEIGGRLLVETIRGMRKGTFRQTPQDEEGASYAPLLQKEDGLINWKREAQQIRNQVRGMIPWPIAFTFWEGKRLKIYQARIGEGRGRAGEILCFDKGIEVACGEGSLVIRELQLEGGKRMSCEEFVRGHRLTVGEQLG